MSFNVSCCINSASINCSPIQKIFLIGSFHGCRNICHFISLLKCSSLTCYRRRTLIESAKLLSIFRIRILRSLASVRLELILFLHAINCVGANNLVSLSTRTICYNLEFRLNQVIFIDWTYKGDEIIIKNKRWILMKFLNVWDTLVKSCRISLEFIKSPSQR